MASILALALTATAQYQPVTLFKAPDASALGAFCYIGNDGTVTSHRHADGQVAERGYAQTAPPSD
jgi:hypothetical protein